MMASTKKTGLDLLREPFPPHQISKLPKPTKAQTDAVRQDFKAGIRCQLCGQWHHPDVVHLDYVGHAALTDRLLECDPKWFWEPVAFNETGLPAFDPIGGLWIRLTVAGHTRLGYGSADGKKGGDAIKEAIGDALRNAAMRFGAALDLWHKGELHVDDAGLDAKDNRGSPEMPEKPTTAAVRDNLKGRIAKATTHEDLDELERIWGGAMQRLETEDEPKALEVRAAMDSKRESL